MHDLMGKKHERKAEAYEKGAGDLIDNGEGAQGDLVTQLAGHHDLSYVCRHIYQQANGKNNETVVESSGNVFVDLGLRDADEKQTRVRLAVAINQIIQARHLSQIAAARLLDINQPKISALVNYRLVGFSVERLMHFLNALDRDVEIVIRKKPRSKRAARIVVTGGQLSQVV